MSVSKNPLELTITYVYILIQFYFFLIFMQKVYVITSWYYNPIHPGHVDCFEMAKALWDELTVIVNNDAQAEAKRGKVSFQDEQFRMRIVWSMQAVDNVFLCIDEDGSVCASIEAVVNIIRQKNTDARIIFAKGGDRFVGNIPEVQVCTRLWVEIVDGLGEKTHSSRDYVVLD